MFLLGTCDLLMKIANPENLTKPDLVTRAPWGVGGIDRMPPSDT